MANKSVNKMQNKTHKYSLKSPLEAYTRTIIEKRLESLGIIMFFASKLRENRFIKFVSFDDRKHPCHNFGS